MAALATAATVVAFLACLLSVGEAAAQERITVDHSYYTMHLYKNNAEHMYDRHYVDMSGSVVHDFLSNHSQAAEAVAPGFSFPFYGHLMDSFYITTHGFLSFAPRLHNLMYKTQYIAPLRVKFDPSLSPHATINYLSQSNQLTIQWTNISVAEPFAHPKGGNFTFQVTIHDNGDIAFVYVSIPELLTSDALYDNEPVAGLSDAFLIGDNELHVYHTLNVENPDIVSGVVAVFKAKPTCVQQDNCQSCLRMRQTSEFACAWCADVGRCSDGADRLREHWDQNQCGVYNASAIDQCTHVEFGRRKNAHGSGGHGADGVPPQHTANEATPLTSSTSSTTVVSAVVSTVLVLVLLILVGVFAYMYGRSNPGGLAERFAMRVDSSYKRFGDGRLGDESHAGAVEMENANGNGGVGRDDASQLKEMRNNNSITVSF